MITKDMRIEETIKVNPHLTDVFNDAGIDFCCNGARPLAVALEEKDLDVGRFIEKLNAYERTTEKKSMAEAMDMEPDALIDHIILHHHIPEKDMLEKADALLQKILFVHYAHHGEELAEIYQVFAQLKGELMAHFPKEEAEVFVKMKAGNYDQVNVLESEHEAAGNLLHKLEDLTQNFTAPEDGCETYRLAFRKLQELAEDVHIHIFLENYVLFKQGERA